MPPAGTCRRTRRSPTPSPPIPTEIKGNFTKEELPADLGYKLPIGVGHASDYNGYTVSYREYMTWDDYRKALTSYGPHTADYMVTRLVRLAGELNGGPPRARDHTTHSAQADEARQLAVSTALGAATSAAYEAWQAQLPDDLGPADASGAARRHQALRCSDVLSGAAVRTRSTTPRSVERLVDGEWAPSPTSRGEVQTKLDFPKGANALFDTYSGGQEWIWTANFEAFDAFPAAIGSTPAATYRFVVDGLIRQAEPTLRTTSSPRLRGQAWDGIAVTDIRLEPTPPDDSVSFDVPAIIYPQTYESEFAYVGVTRSRRGRQALLRDLQLPAVGISARRGRCRDGDRRATEREASNTLPQRRAVDGRRRAGDPSPVTRLMSRAVA